MYIDFTDQEQATSYLSYIIDGNKHSYYDYTVEHAAEMSVHIKGDQPGALLNDYRPNEPAEIHDYRLRIWQPITKSSSKRAISVIQRINNSRYYSIDFPPQPDSITDTLETYLTTSYPRFDSLIHWLFDVALKDMLNDPNGVVAVLPIDLDVPDNEYYQPYTFCYRSDQVIDKGENYYTILLDEKSPVKVGQVEKLEGNIYYVFTEKQLIEFRQVGVKADDKYEQTTLLTYNLSDPPVFELGGEYVSGTYPMIYESFMSGILPFWNDAVREYSDKQANFVQHVYLERVEMQVRCDNRGCMPQDELQGMYGIKSGDGCKVCERCSGTGYISGRSPYGITVVKDKDWTEAQEKQEFPGVTYIDKPTEIVTLLTDDIKELIKKGFEAINMDILNEVGENQSGVAKTIDRSDLDAFLLSISNRLFNIYSMAAYYIGYFRYSNVLQDWQDYLPDVNKPTNFDVLTSGMLADILQAAKQAKLNPHLIDELEKDYVNKQFGSNEKLRRKHTLYIELDPLSNVSEEDKYTRLINGGITRTDYIVSSNIKQFVNRALQEQDFLELERSEQLAILRGYASEQVQNIAPIPNRGEDGQ